MHKEAITDSEIRQRDAYGRLVDALIEKANKELNELQKAHDNILKIKRMRRENKRTDKNYNPNGLLQRNETYRARKTAANTKLESTLREAYSVLDKMVSEIGYTSIDALGSKPSREIRDRRDKINQISFQRKLLITPISYN